MAAILGTTLGFLAILLGQWISGGQIGQILSVSGFLIVVGGTFGAVLLAYPFPEFKRAMGLIPQAYSGGEGSRGSLLAPLIDEIVKSAELARKEGLLALESQRSSLRDRHFKEWLRFAAEGMDAASIREILDSAIETSSQELRQAADVLETAGAFAPPIGIIGAVLGLIQVMALLSDPSQLGKIGEGIGSAFVSAIYGLGLAYLLLQPWASKLRRIAEHQELPLELAAMGVIGIADGTSPSVLREKLNVRCGNAG